MKVAITSKDEILKVSKDMVMAKGISSINMRVIANQCGLAVGSIYNYFPSKADLISTTIKYIWEDILKPIHKAFEHSSFIDCVSCLFETIKDGGEQYPGFFSIHSLNFASEDKEKGKEVMNHYFSILKSKLATCLSKDENIRKEVFQEHLSEEQFVSYIFTLLLSILLQKQNDCKPLLEMIQHCIY